jgi:hypothetical protein
VVAATLAHHLSFDANLRHVVARSIDGALAATVGKVTA